MSQLQVTGEAKVRDIQGPVVANSGVITALDGDASQYVRGDGTLADFPTSTGGGSSVSYYLNSSVSQGTIGGVAYRQLGKTPIIGAGTDITISANGYVASYITDANDPALLEVPAGNFNCEFYFSVNSNAHNPYVYAEVYKYDGTTFSLIGTSVGVPEYLSNGTTLSPYYFAIPVSQTVLTITDRIAIRIYVNVDGRTVTLHTENGHLCQVVTTFSKGLTSLNNLTRQVQFLATGTSGTDFNISSATATHTFNLPIASASNTGKLSSTDWSTFNGKVPYTGANANVDLGLNNLLAYRLYSKVNSSASGQIFLGQGTVFNNDTGYSTIGADTSGKFYFIPFIAGDGRTGIFDFNTITSNVQRTFTFPDASGTLALTSNLSAYLPLTGGILTGTTRMDGSGGTTEPITMIFNTGINRLLAPVLRLFGATNVGSNYVELFGSLATQNRTINFPDASGTVALTSQLTGGTVTSVGLSSATSGVTIGSTPITTSGTITLAIATASGSQNGLISSSDWTTFNNKQNALINPVTGTGTINTLPKFTGTSTIGDSAITDNGTTVTLVSRTLGGTSAVFSSSVSASSLDASQIINKQAGTSPSFALIRNVSGYATWLGIDGNNDFNIFDNDATSLAFSVRVNANRGQITAPFYGGSSNVILGANNSGTLTKMVIGSGLSFDGTTLTVPLSNYLPLSGGTLSGNLSIVKASGASVFTLDSGTGFTNQLNFAINGTSKGLIYVSDNFYQFNNYSIYGYLFKNAAGNNIFALQDNGSALFSSSVSATTFAGINFVVSNATSNSTITSVASTSRNITLPDASGTIALLSGTQTFTGATTFSSDLLVNGVRVGIGSGGSNNARFGALSFMSNTTGSFNTAIGTYTLNANTTGSSNTALGNVALFLNTTGSSNTAIGAYALQNNTTGSQNISIGDSSLPQNTTGVANTSIGYASLSVNTSGNYNVSLGGGNGNAITTGSNNLLIGYNTGNGITTGSNNTIIGGSVFGLSATLSNNIILADGAGNIRYQWNGTNNVFGNPISATSATFSGALTMGAYSFASSAIQFTRANTNTVSPGSGNGILVFAGGNAQMRIGTANDVNFDMFNGGTPYTVLKLQQNGNTVYINSPDNSLPLAFAYQGTIHGYMGAVSSTLYALSNNGGYVYLSSSSTWIPASDVKRKRNFETYSLGLDAILGLKPKRYNMDFQEDGDEKQVGLIAQEVKEHIPQAFEQSEDFIGINYNVIIVTLVNAIQELETRIKQLENK